MTSIEAPPGFERLQQEGFLGHLDGIWTRRHDTGLDTCLLVLPHHLNPNGTVHGGVLLALLDYTLGGTTEQVLVNSAENGSGESLRHPITISLTTPFAGAARLGPPLLGRAWVQHRTRSITFVAGELTSGDLTVATASAIFKTSTAPT